MEPSQSAQNINFLTVAQELASGNAAQRTSAARLLEGLDAEGKREVARQVIRNVKATRRTAISLLCLMLVLGACWQVSRFWVDVEASARILFVPMLGIFCAFFYVFLRPLRRQYYALAQALAVSGD